MVIKNVAQPSVPTPNHKWKLSVGSARSWGTQCREKGTYRDSEDVTVLVLVCQKGYKSTCNNTVCITSINTCSNRCSNTNGSEGSIGNSNLTSSSSRSHSINIDMKRYFFRHITAHYMQGLLPQQHLKEGWLTGRVAGSARDTERIRWRL